MANWMLVNNPDPINFVASIPLTNGFIPEINATNTAYEDLTISINYSSRCVQNIRTCDSLDLSDNNSQSYSFTIPTYKLVGSLSVTFNSNTFYPSGAMTALLAAPLATDAANAESIRTTTPLPTIQSVLDAAILAIAPLGDSDEIEYMIHEMTDAVNSPTVTDPVSAAAAISVVTTNITTLAESTNTTFSIPQSICLDETLAIYSDPCSSSCSIPGPDFDYIFYNFIITGAAIVTANDTIVLNLVSNSNTSNTATLSYPNFNTFPTGSKSLVVAGSFVPNTSIRS